MNTRTKLIEQIDFTQQTLVIQKNNLYRHQKCLQHSIHDNKFILSVVVLLTASVVWKLSPAKHFLKGITKIGKMGVLWLKLKFV